METEARIEGISVEELIEQKKQKRIAELQQKREALKRAEESRKKAEANRKAAEAAEEEQEEIVIPPVDIVAIQTVSDEDGEDSEEEEVINLPHISSEESSDLESDTEEVGKMATISNKISSKDLPTFTGEKSENPLAFRNTLESTLDFYTILPVVGGGRNVHDAYPHMAITLKVFRNCLRGRPLQWFNDHVVVANVNSVDDWNDMLDAFVREFHPLGKTRLEWEAAWKGLQRKDFPTLYAFVEKAKETARLIGKTNDEVVALAKMYATNIETQCIHNMTTPEAILTALKEYTARDKVALGGVDINTQPALPFMAMQDGSAIIYTKLVDTMAALSDSVQKLSVDIESKKNTTQNSQTNTSQSNNRGRSKERRPDPRYDRRNGSKGRTPSYDKRDNRPRSQSRDYNGQSRYRDSSKDRNYRYPSQDRYRSERDRYRPESRDRRYGDYSNSRSQGQNGNYRPRDSSREYKSITWRCEICQSPDHPYFKCPIKEQVHMVEQRNGGYRQNNYQKMGKNKPRASTPKPDVLDKLNAFLDAQMDDSSNE